MLREECVAMQAREKDFLLRAIAAGRADVSLYCRLAELADQSGDLDAARTYLARAKAQPQDNDSKQQLALLEVRLLRLSRRSARADELETELHLAEARAAQRRSDRPATRAALNKALARAGTPYSVELCLFEATVLESEGDLEAAEKALRAGGKAHPKVYWFPIRLARLTHERGAKRAARQFFDKAHKLAVDP
ncbi:tetratricopeptide repeat protein [Candidatus Rhodobacter oscarellae]|uniref:tetratricopeptide repeat protein n=1 Tax=Candidatus Rhodobacter oscarellae TaxID=1675527 RepID=UPI00128F11F8|nr:hypothetical protein [Candidatus Rhodobacter lobularis]